VDEKMSQDIAIRIHTEGVEEVAEDFRRIGKESENLNVNLRSTARDVASLGASAVAVGKLGEQFGVLNKQQADVLVTMGSMVSLSATVVRGLDALTHASTVLKLAEMARGAAHAFADSMAAGVTKISSTIVGAFSAIASSSWAVAIAEKARAVAHAIAHAVSSLGVLIPVITVAAAGALAAVLTATGKIPGLAAGGIVTAPTVALVGEREPEAIVPLSKFRLEDRVSALESSVELHRKFINELAETTAKMGAFLSVGIPFGGSVFMREFYPRFIGIREETETKKIGRAHV
jgi:hypothetical protein